MNPVVQAQLKAFEEANSSIELSTSEYFEVFTIHAVLNGIQTESVDPFEAHLEGDEFGLDGIAILIQGQLCQSIDAVVEALEFGKNHQIEFVLFQSKTGTSMDYGDVSKFFDGAYSFFDGTFLTPTSQLKDFMDAMGAVYGSALKTNPTLRLVYATTGTGQISDQIKKLADARRSTFEDLNIFSSIELDFLGARALQDGYRSATNSNSNDIEISKPITLPDHGSVQQAFLGFVPAEGLVKLATQDPTETQPRRINRAVFFDNVRDFNEKSEINAEILKDLVDGGQDSFIFKNNGVTVVAKEVSRKGDKFTLEDYQIVNGCQTCNTLFLAGDDAKGAHVPFRLIVSSDPDFVSTIIVGTNRQNEVKDDQFWALKPFMKDLEEYSKQQQADLRLFVERREHQYRNESVERTRIIKPSELIKSVAAMFIFQPHRAARDYRGIRKEYSEKIFLGNHSVIPYHTAAYASYRIDFAIRNKRVPREWGIYKYYVLSMIGKSLTGDIDIFALPVKKQEAICNQIVDLISDEENLIKQITSAAHHLDNAIGAAKLDTREKIRDYIRSETVADDFHKKIVEA